MKQLVFFTPVCLGILLCAGTLRYSPDPPAHQLVREMFGATQNIRTLTYIMRKKERIEGKYAAQESFIKLQRDPYRVYLKVDPEGKAREVLFTETDDEALVNPNGFPWFNLRLDPYGSIMRSSQHHTIHRCGFDYVASIMEYNYNKYLDKIASMISHQRSVEWDGQECWVLEFENPDFGFSDYTVQEGETVLSIAERLKISPYLILERNELDDYDEVEAGEVIKIPGDYAARFILYLDKKRKVPLLLKVYDDQGLFEQYAYVDLKVNPPLQPEEFTKDYKGYGF